MIGGVRRAPDPKGEHDLSSHHFYTAAAREAQKRAEALRKSGSTDKLTVIMYEPAYEVRATNDKKADPATGTVDPHYHRKLMEKAASRDHYEVKFVRTKKEMLDEMAKATATNPMKNGGYFGHTTKDKFLLDYGENPPPSGTTEDVAYQTISLDDLKKAGVRFQPDAHFASYGCNQGEPGGMMEQLSKDQHIKTSGSDGKTKYQAIGQGYSIPYSVNGYSTYQNGLPVTPQIVSPTPPPPKP